MLRRPLEQGEENVLLGPNGPDACLDAGAATAYLNHPAVKQALHVPPACNSFIVRLLQISSS